LSKGAPRSSRVIASLAKDGACRRKTGVKQYWAYMLRCRDDSYYIGVTSELEIRLAKHALGLDEKAYTFRRRPVKLVHAEVFYTPEEAIHAEKRLKGWSRAKKDALVRGDWDTIRRLSRSATPSRKSNEQH
jgi:putative endonuclease